MFQLRQLPTYVTIAAFAMLLISITLSMAGLVGQGGEIGMAVSGLLLCHAIMAVGCTTCLTRSRLRGWMISGLVASTSGWLLLTFALLQRVWLATVTTDVIVFGVLASSWAMFMMIVGLLHCASLPKVWMRVLRCLTVAMTAGTMIMVLASSAILLLVELADLHESFRALGYRLLQAGGVGVVLVVLGLTGVWLIARMRILMGTVEDSAPQLPYRCVCPRCQIEAMLMTGTSNCKSCGLSIQVQLT